MPLSLVMLSGQARMLGKSRQLTYHKSSPILPGEPRRTSPLLLRWNRTILMVSCDGFEPFIDVRKPSVLPFELTGHRYFFVANSCDIVCVEDINLRGLAGSLHLGKSTNDNGFGMLREFLQYKLEEQGKSFIKIDRNYPSSQMCGNCGVLNPDVKDLSLREWTCPCRGAHHDRDVNAARNILRAGVDIYYAPKEEPEPKKTSRGGRKSLRNKKTKAA